jgi:pentatricopeptide repeat protein
MGITPDEGICMQVLVTAGRHGLPDLGDQVLRVLQGMKVSWKEHHFAPLIEALCGADRLSDAFDVLEMMRSASVALTPETAQPIFRLISKDVDAVDNAYGVLEQMREQEKTIDVAALNVVVQAAVALGDLQRAVGTYKAASSLGVAPDADTFNLLLAGCIAAAHRELGTQLLAEMTEAGVVPNTRTFERLVVLCLTQENYEDAFYYLEEMKAQKHVPPVAVYEAIVRRCVSMQDVRHELALAEMREMGYEVSPSLRAFIASSGQTDAPQVEREASVDDKARLFLEGEDGEKKI